MLSRLQILVLIAIALVVITLFALVAFLSQNLFQEIEYVEGIQETSQVLIALSTQTPTGTPSHTPTATDTVIPSPTNTRVVTQTATVPPTRTPLPTATPTTLPTSTSTPTADPASIPLDPTPTPIYPFFAIPPPQIHDSTNHFLTIMVNITDGSIPLGDYRLVGTNTKTGDTVTSETSCWTYCKASGPEYIWVQIEDIDKFDEDANAENDGRVFPTDDGRILDDSDLNSNFDDGVDDDSGKEYVYIDRNEIIASNLVFEYPFFESSTWYFHIVDAYGRQVSPTFELVIVGDERRWYYYRFVRQYDYSNPVP